MLATLWRWTRAGNSVTGRRRRRWAALGVAIVVLLLLHRCVPERLLDRPGVKRQPPPSTEVASLEEAAPEDTARRDAAPPRPRTRAEPRAEAPIDVGALTPVDVEAFLPKGPLGALGIPPPRLQARARLGDESRAAPGLAGLADGERRAVMEFGAFEPAFELSLADDSIARPDLGGAGTAPTLPFPPRDLPLSLSPDSERPAPPGRGPTPVTAPGVLGLLAAGLLALILVRSVRPKLR